MVKLALLVVLFVGAVAGAATAAAHWVLPWVTPIVSPVVQAPPQPDPVLGWPAITCGPRPVPTPAPAPRVEIVFALDTTGSMGGLIDGAKKKIWSIATQIERGQPKPELKVGLVAYRDKGDEYVTRVTPLTDNLDGIYSEISRLQAAGGGDTPENVRQGLHDALTQIQWSGDASALRIIFLVGDAPPRNDYTDVPSIEQLCATAAKREIVINTIRCGVDRQTEMAWADIARRSEGSYASIAQNGGVAVLTTPFDGDLATAARELDGTALVYGRAIERQKAKMELRAAAGAPAPEAADRAAFKAGAARYRSDDLVDAVREGRVDLADMDEESLPAELHGVKAEERAEVIKKTAERRAEIAARVKSLTEKRQAWLAENQNVKQDAFDAAVLGALRRQAAKKGIVLPE